MNKKYASKRNMNEEKEAFDDNLKRTEHFMNAIWGFSSDSDDNSDDNTNEIRKRKNSRGIRCNLEYANEETEKQKSYIKLNKDKKKFLKDQLLKKNDKIPLEITCLKRRIDSESSETLVKKEDKKRKRKEQDTLEDSGDSDGSKHNRDIQLKKKKKKEKEQDETKNRNIIIENINRGKKGKKKQHILIDKKEGSKKNEEHVPGNIALIHKTSGGGEKKKKKNEKENEERKEKRNTKEKTSKLKLLDKEKNETNKTLENQRKEFQNALQEIRNIAKEHLDKFQKAIVLNREIKELGGKFDKSRKMPYPELIHRKRAMKKYILRRKEMERHAGVKFQSGDYIDMQDVFRKKKKERKKGFKLF